MLLYIWFLLTIPADHVLCSLWISEIPTPAALVETCGTDALGAYRLDVLHEGQIVCTRPASILMDIEDACELDRHLSDYRLNIVEPDYQETIGCSVTTTTSAQPSAEEVRRQCPNVWLYEIRFAGTRQADPEPSETMCLPPHVDQPASITTTQDLYLLAGKLIWWGFAQSACDGGFSGVIPESYSATPCGLDGARPEMIKWQNGLNTEILAAAKQWHVPAMLIKGIIAAETQFWPWTGTDGEHGLIQITEDGAELVLHQYQDGYDRLTPQQRYEARITWLRQLDCTYCSPMQAYHYARIAMNDYAKAFAAYYCTYGDWTSAMRAWNIKHKLYTE